MQFKLLLPHSGYLFTAIFIVLLFVTTASAQTPREPCTLTEAPAFSGLKLGMARSEFIANFPGTAPINIFNRGDLLGLPKFRGIERIVFTTLKDKLDYLEIVYVESSARPDNEDFLKGLSSFLKLPAGAWKPDAKMAVMTCAAFRVEASSNILKFTDLAAEKIRQDAKRGAKPPTLPNSLN